MPLELRILEYPVETDSGYSVEGAVSLNGRAYRTRLYFQEIEGVPKRETGFGQRCSYA